MLKGIDPIITPDLLHALAKMGHGQTLAVVDRNYPPYSAGAPVVHLAGVDAPTAVAAICSLFPLDTFVESPLAAMEAVGEAERPPVTAEVVAAAEAADGRPLQIRWLERFAFYAEAESASLVISTGEARPYGCYLLTKGVWPSFVPGSGVGAE
ncbi:MAG: fucose isomerase [Bifidobacteriaceae bacterium]|jgi:L-fucose mutarotase|nr:fucose isomerase [Bifidobacteriaceae bacterium]